VKRAHDTRTTRVVWLLPRCVVDDGRQRAQNLGSAQRGDAAPRATASIQS